MADWPATLPLFEADGAQFQPGRRGRRFEVDEGPAKQRQVNTKAVETANLQLRCDADARAVFDTFYAGQCGGIWFTNFTHPRTGMVTRARFVVGKEPVYSVDPPYWVIAMTLEIE